MDFAMPSTDTANRVRYWLKYDILRSVLTGLAVIYLIPVGDFALKLFVLITGPLLVAYFSHRVVRPHLRTFKQKMTGLGLTLLAAFGLVIIVASFFSCWCCIRHRDLQLMCDTLSETARVLEEHNVPYWICWGSLLGAVREQGLPFQAIPWEHDSDICLEHKHLKAATDALVQHGFELQDDETQGDDSARVMLPSLHARMARIYVDLFTAEPAKHDSSQLVMVRGSPQPVYFPATDVYPFQQMKHCNREFPAPAKPTPYLTSFYDASFMTPSFKLSVHGIQCRLFMDCAMLQSPITHPFIEGLLAWIFVLLLSAVIWFSLQALDNVLDAHLPRYGIHLNWKGPDWQSTY